MTVVETIALAGMTILYEEGSGDFRMVCLCMEPFLGHLR